MWHAAQEHFGLPALHFWLSTSPAGGYFWSRTGNPKSSFAKPGLVSCPVRVRGGKTAGSRGLVHVPRDREGEQGRKAKSSRSLNTGET